MTDPHLPPARPPGHLTSWSLDELLTWGWGVRRACTASVDAWVELDIALGSRPRSQELTRAQGRARRRHALLLRVGRETARRQGPELKQATERALEQMGRKSVEVLAWPHRRDINGAQSARAHAFGWSSLEASEAMVDLCSVMPVWAWASFAGRSDHRGLPGVIVRLNDRVVELVDELPVLCER